MEQIKVTDTSSERLDKRILRQIPEIGIGRLNKYLRENKIKVNGKKQPLSYKVNKGDIINLYLPDKNSIENKKPLSPAFNAVYEDENIIIADKPAGLPVEDKADNDSLLKRCTAYLKAKNINDNALLCHRLDTGTSGLVIIAKNAESYEALSDLIKERKIVKEYLCVSFGHPSPPKATLHAHLTKNAADGIVYVDDTPQKNSREIITKYETIAKSGPLAMLTVQLITGRTHQIRAHMAHIGCPLLGDSKYGNNSANRKFKLKYQALCAYKLTFPRLENSILKAVTQKSFTASEPWYYSQMIDGTLGKS